MAPLVVIRAGAKEVEYRDCSRVWTRSLVPSVREDGDGGGSEHGDDASDNDDDDSSSDADDDNEDGGGGVHTAKRSIYGFSSELYELGGMRVFRCADCGNVVADRDDIIAKSFFGKTGKAFLMNGMFNIRSGTPRNRFLMTGMHTICDVLCGSCDVVLGWKYLKAMEPSQKYKEGKFIMERAVVHDDAEDKSWKRL